MQLSRDFKGVWIQKEIWLDTSLSLLEKCLFAELHSLDGQDGCFASNQYLCTFLSCGERNLQMALASLKNRGYITYESFDGRTRVIRTNIKTIYEKLCTPEVKKISPLGCKNLHPSSQDTYYIERKEETKEQQQVAVFSCLEKINIPQSDKDWIMDKYKDREADVQNAVAYATHPDTPITKCLAAAIKWACEKKPEVPTDKVKVSQDNRAIGREIAEKTILPKISYLTETPEGYEIGFTTGTKAPVLIKFTENGFKEQLESQIRKHGGNFK